MAHSNRIRAECMAALLAGQSVTLVAKEHDLPLTTVSKWGKIARLEAGQEEEIGEMLLDNLRGNIRARDAMYETFMDPEWQRAQSASELGVCFGILDDKSYRMLTAMNGSPVAKGTGK